MSVDSLDEKNFKNLYIIQYSIEMHWFVFFNSRSRFHMFQSEEHYELRTK